MSSAQQRDRQYAGRKASARKAERRARLIEAAIGVYARKGYGGATVREICAEAGLTSRYFYESFTSGEDLFIACYGEVVDHILAVLSEAAADNSGTVRDGIAAVHHAYFSELRDRPALAQVFLMDLSNISPALERMFEEATQRTAQLFARAVPVRHPDDTVQLLVRSALVGGIVHIARLWVRGDFQLPIESVEAAALELYDRAPLPDTAGEFPYSQA